MEKSPYSPSKKEALERKEIVMWKSFNKCFNKYGKEENVFVEKFQYKTHRASSLSRSVNTHVKRFNKVLEKFIWITKEMII